MSVLLHVDPDVAPLVPLAAGLAVVEAIEAGWGVELQLTWPNDVVHVSPDGGPDRKLAGILAEAMVIVPQAGSVPTLAVVVGTGINLDLGDTWRAVAPEDVRARAVDLTELSGSALYTTELPATPIRRDDVADAVLRRLEVTLDDMESTSRAFVDRYRRRCVTIGRSVELTHPAGPVQGTAVDVDDAGFLVLETSDGRKAFDAGEVHTRRD